MSDFGLVSPVMDLSTTRTPQIVEFAAAGGVRQPSLAAGPEEGNALSAADRTTEAVPEGEPQHPDAALREAYQLLERRVEERTREIERRRQVAEGVHDVLAILNSNRSLDDVLVYILTRASRLLEASAGVVHHIDFERRLVTIEVEVGLPPALRAVRTFPLQEGAATDAIRARKPLVVSHTLPPESSLYKDIGAPLVPPAMRRTMQEFHRGFLAVPLVVKEAVYGTLVFYTTASRTFSDEDVALALAFADQAALAIENAQLRVRVTEAAVAAERSRLARDLHDAVTQTLFSASLIAEVLPRLWERNPAEGRRRLEELRQLTRGALAEMRTLLIELRPTALIEASLDELLHQLVEAVSLRSRVPITLNITGGCALPAEARVALYRIAQEALNNVAKHAGASCAELELSCGPDGYSLLIGDDGRGFDMTAVTAEHLGLDIMRERAETIGATLAIDSQPGRGTRVRVNGHERSKEDR
jgi:signal transduction histidine kinase